MDVTWDSAKNKKNIAERQLPLSICGSVLDDEMRIERHDKKHCTPEQDRLTDAEEKRLYYRINSSVM
jgi:uncharacterized DUF497 family protein